MVKRITNRNDCFRISLIRIPSIFFLTLHAFLNIAHISLWNHSSESFFNYIICLLKKEESFVPVAVRTIKKIFPETKVNFRLMRCREHHVRFWKEHASFPGDPVGSPFQGRSRSTSVSGGGKPTLERGFSPPCASVITGHFLFPACLPNAPCLDLSWGESLEELMWGDLLLVVGVVGWKKCTTN